MKFTKMQCAGNDFFIITCFDEIFENLSASAEAICDRHFGVGADGLVLILKSDLADYKLRFFNPDGTETEISGNGILCAGKYLSDNNLIDGNEIKIETMAGVKELYIDGDTVKVNMGEPVFTPQLIPVDYTGDEFINKVISVENEEYAITCVSVGNPHAVIYPDDLYNLDVEEIGRKIELHQIFPKRTNVEFVKVIDDSTLEMRCWSRGTGETMSCGSGACAALVSSVENELCKSLVTVRNIGGELLIEWNEDSNSVYLKGTAVKTFDGEIELN